MAREPQAAGAESPADGVPRDTVVDPAHQRTGDDGLLRPGFILERRFVIVRLLGSGGMGEVYEAEDLSLRRARIALKTVRAEWASREDLLQRFRNEVLLARSIAHSNVCPVYEIFSSEIAGGEIWFLTMKLLEGETLLSHLEGKALARDEAVRIAREIAAGLDAIHSAGVVHRDLKPGNIFLERFHGGERAVVTDFGLAHGSAQESVLTNPDHVVGTPSYIAPEVRAGGAATPQSDLYSFGVILHELFLGERPDSVATVSMAVAPRTQERRRLREVIARCLAYDPRQRFESAGLAVGATERAIDTPIRVTRRQLMVAAGGAATALGFGAWSQREEIEWWLNPVPRPRRVAIMPSFGAAGPVEDASLLGGILESVSARLERVRGSERDLFIVPAREIGKRNVADASQVGSLLGANLLLSASLSHLRDAITVRFQLASGATGKLLRESYVSVPMAAIQSAAKLAADRAALLLDLSPTGLPHQSEDGDSTNAEAFAAYQRGRGLLLRQGSPDVDSAIQQLRRAVDLDPNFAHAFASLADAYTSKYALSHDVAALELADRNASRALTLVPGLAAGFHSRAKIEFQKGSYDAVIADLQAAARLDPANEEVRLVLAKTYGQLGKFVLADRTYDQLSKDRPNDWFVPNDWGHLCLSQAEYQRAATFFREASMLAPGAALPLGNLGAAYLSMGKLQEAESALSRSIAILPFRDSYSNLGTTLYFGGKYAQAADAYRKAIDFAPLDPTLWGNLGDAYQMERDKTKAKIAWKKAAELTVDLLAVNPGGAEQLLNVALYNAKLGERAASVQYLEKIDKSHSLTVEQLFTETTIYELVGYRDMALRLLKQCVRLGYSGADILHAPELAELRKDPRFKELGVSAAEGN